ncbi:DMT family transporter [Rhodococcus sp. NPDC057529]|uniref:EamA family transporter n=1 Tax=Rhodococcus sp. NPDC057529 TaxID=3346158 RepID=UPI00366B0A6F
MPQSDIRSPAPDGLEPTAPTGVGTSRDSEQDDSRTTNRRRRSSVTGITLSLASSIANQSGAGIGALAFPSIGPVGVVAVRQIVAAVVLGIVARPSVRGLRWPQVWPVLALAVTLSMMNLSLYTAVDRIGLGLAVSLEFLGPLSVALFALRRPRDWIFAVTAGIGVYVLVLPGPSTDYLGVALGLLAATCWATYILLNQLVGQRCAGLKGSALATGLAAALYSPVIVVLAAEGSLWGKTLVYTAAAGILASAIPYAADMMALRHLPAGTFAILTSLNPVWAALAGMAFLGQFLTAHEWLGMGCIAASNIAVVISQNHPAKETTKTRAHSARPNERRRGTPRHSGQARNG